MTTKTLSRELETKELVKLFEGLDTPSVSDALDKIGIHGQALGIMPFGTLQRYVDAGSRFLAVAFLYAAPTKTP